MSHNSFLITPYKFFPPWRGSWVWVGQLLRFKLFLFIGKIKVAILSLPPDDVSVEQWLALFLAMPKVRVRISAEEFYLKNLFLSRNRQFMTTSIP